MERMGTTGLPKNNKKTNGLGNSFSNTISLYNKENLEKGEYKTLHEYACDIRLIWSNCMIYNQV